jgi:hypothetical protein
MSKYDDIIEGAAKQYNVDPALINAVIGKESNGDTTAFNPAGGGEGAAGLMQVRAPALSDFNAANGTKYTMADLKKPEVGIPVGSWYLGQQLDKFNDPSKALIAYNEGAGSPNVAKGNTPYSQSVMSRIGAQQVPAAPATLPGIPTSQAIQQGDDAIFAQFSKGGSPSAIPAAPNSDDAIFAAMTRAPGAAKPTASTPAVAQPAAPQGDQPGMLASFGAGLGRGVQETALGAQQLIGHGAQAIGLNGIGNWLVNDANQGLQAGAQQVAPYSAAHPIVTGAGNLAGSMAATAPLGALAPVARTLPGMAAVGAGMGGLTAALSPVDPNSQNFAADKAQQIGLGALTGGVLSPAVGALGRIISPNVSPDVQTLLDRGVTPTPGQILGGGFARTEEKLSSVPVLGDMIKNAQQRAVGQLNQAAYNEALAPIGETFSGKVGQEGIEQVEKKIGNVYDKVLPQMQLRVDPQFQADVINLGQMANGLPQAQQGTFTNILKTQIFDKLTAGGSMDGQTLKGVQSELARTASGYLKDPSFDNRQLGAAVSALRDAVDGNLSRVNPPDLAEQLANANQAWANYARLRAAASSIGAANNEGVFTAAQLQNAVKASDKSVGKGAFATGNALMQDLSGAGQRVLGSKYPDSGTVGRGLLSLLAPTGIAAGFAAQPTATLATLGGIGFGSLPYTQLGQRAAAALLTARPQFAQPVGNAVTALGRLAVPGSLPALLSGSR